MDVLLNKCSTMKLLGLFQHPRIESISAHSAGHPVEGSYNPAKGDRIFGRVRPNPPASRSFETKTRCVQGIQRAEVFSFLRQPQVKSKLLPSEYSN